MIIKIIMVTRITMIILTMAAIIIVHIITIIIIITIVIVIIIIINTAVVIIMLMITRLCNYEDDLGYCCDIYYKVLFLLMEKKLAVSMST